MEILALLVDPHEILGERRGDGPREHRLGRDQGPGIRGRLFAFPTLRRPMADPDLARDPDAAFLEHRAQASRGMISRIVDPEAQVARLGVCRDLAGQLDFGAAGHSRVAQVRFALGHRDRMIGDPVIW